MPIAVICTVLWSGFPWACVGGLRDIYRLPLVDADLQVNVVYSGGTVSVAMKCSELGVFFWLVKNLRLLPHDADP